jgi:hypothetical protein
MLGVGLPGGLTMPIPLTAIDQSGADHHLNVPTGTKLILTAYSATYTMTDGNGAAIDKQAGYSLPINIPAGTAQLKETITIH